ncbi:MAG: pyruvate formate lyase family protein, partial [Erysipelotrichaceae bacterium]|nr:pyruvate formate lyase family protein [Erysipelotrichaceae bacterium]
MIERILKKNEQNVAVAPKEPLYKTDVEQLEIMVRYTETHKQFSDAQKLEREIACLNVLFPHVFRPMYEGDLMVGRYDALPIGFGSVTSVGAPGHYCRFDQMAKMKSRMDEKCHSTIDELIAYWKIHDTREIFYKDNLLENVLGPFVDVRYPVIITARFSGMYLDYNKLLDYGIVGLMNLIESKKEINPSSIIEYKTMIEALKLLQKVVDHHISEVKTLLSSTLLEKRKHQLVNLLNALTEIRTNRPSTMLAAMQLAWLYSSVAGVVNYGRMDDYLGDYLVNDLTSGRLNEEEAIELILSQWRLIEVKRTNVNGRVIVGGRGRRNEKNADVFCKLAIEATKRAQMVEPQFTLRFYDG